VVKAIRFLEDYDYHLVIDLSTDIPKDPEPTNMSGDNSGL
jgi:hypothetical protein